MTMQTEIRAERSMTPVDLAYMEEHDRRLLIVDDEEKIRSLFAQCLREQYSCETALVDLSEIANGVKKLPREWVNEDGISMNFQFHRYALPLIQGEVAVPFENGLPSFAKLSKVPVDKLLPGYEV